MRTHNDLLLDAEVVAASANSRTATADHLLMYDITAGVTASNPSNDTFATGAYEVQTLTFPAKAGATAGDYVVFYDQSGTAWAASLDVTGSDPEPTGDAWAAVAAGNKVHVDISGATTAANVAALVETDIDGLTGFTAVITSDDSAADGTMTLTQVVPGVTTNASTYVEDDTGGAGNGSISAAETTPGTATAVDPDNNQVTAVGHGFTTGMKITELTTTGTLPAGLATSTVYYAIVVDSDTLSFATSQANAAAGTAVNITDYGAGTHTIVVETTIAGAVKLQKNNEPAGEDPVWFDITSSSQSFTGTDTKNWAAADIAFRELRAVATVTSGTVTVSVRLNAKGL